MRYSGAPRRLGFVLGAAVLALLAYHFFFGIMVIERMSGQSFGGQSAFFVYRSTFLVLMCLALLVARVRIYGTAIGFVLLLALAIGAIFGSYDVSFKEYSAHAIQAATSVLSFFLGLAFAQKKVNALRIWKHVSYGYLVASIVFLVVYFRTVTPQTADDLRHYSLNFYLLIIPFGYFLSKKKYVMAAATLLLMAACGKRAVFVAGVLMAVWFFITVMKPRDVLPIAVVGCVAFLAIVLIDPQMIVDLLWRRWTGAEDLNTLSSFRGDLVSSVLSDMNENPASWLVGSGFGASFFFAYKDVVGVMYGVDVMPLHFLFMYGLPITAVVFAVLATTILSSRRVIVSSFGGSRVLNIAQFHMLVGYVACFMLTYVTTDPVFWFLVGTCTHAAIQSKRSAVICAPYPAIPSAQKR